MWTRGQLFIGWREVKDMHIHPIIITSNEIPKQAQLTRGSERCEPNGAGLGRCVLAGQAGRSKSAPWQQ